MTMWVWRLSGKKDFTDDVRMQQHKEFFEQSTHPNPRQYVNCNFALARPGQCRTWLINEIFNQQKLRQGWCGIDLDLNLLEAIWIRNYQLIDPGKSSLAEVEKQYRILICLLDIRIGDTIFLPRVGKNKLSDNHFTVVTVAGNYYFENPNDIMYWRSDFGHVIPVDGNLNRTFPYSQTTLQSGDFGAPFIARVVRVPNSFYRGFDDFLRRHKYPFNPY